MLFHYGEYFRVEIIDPSRKIIRNIPGHVVYHDEKFRDGHALFFRKERILLPEPVKVLGKIDDSSRDTRGMAVDALECFLSGIGIPVGMMTDQQVKRPVNALAGIQRGLLFPRCGSPDLLCLVGKGARILHILYKTAHMREVFRNRREQERRARFQILGFSADAVVVPFGEGKRIVLRCGIRTGFVRDEENERIFRRSCRGKRERE